MSKGHDLSPGILIGIFELWPYFSSVAASATIIAIVFLQYRYNGDCLKRYPDITMQFYQSLGASLPCKFQSSVLALKIGPFR